MIADDVAGANGVKSDLLVGPFAGHAFPPVLGDIGQVDVEPARDGFAQSESGAAGSVFLETVVLLDDSGGLLELAPQAGLRLT